MMSLFLVEKTALFGMDPLALVILLLLVGMFALGIELFILPGFGVAGIIGLILLGGGVVAAWYQYGAEWGALIIVLTIVVTIALVVVGLKTRLVRKRFVLDTRLAKGRGTDAEDMTGWIGKTGIAKSDLRPAGIAIVDDRRIDVVSEGGFIDATNKVKIVAVDGPRVIVARNKE
jgi:membrane-bound serine protease (ClpP class)